jgi:crotonobetainyl-CoA:carnitine CoA-transferase CaiB-like acyl-CoA transferase
VGPSGYARQVDPLRQPFPTSDGHISIVVYNHDSWDRLFALLGDPAFIAEERFTEPGGRGRHQNALYTRLAELTPRFTTAELLERCHAVQLPAQPVRDLSEVIEDPHLNAVGYFRRRQHPSEGRYIEQSPPVSYRAWPAAELSPPPGLDADGAAIRAEVGPLHEK